MTAHPIPDRPRTFAPNPVVPGFHPDPSICRVDDTYWMVCSSFELLPGIPVFRSTDLVTWEQVGNVIERPGQLTLSRDVPSSAGVYAPTLRHHDGEFWVVVTVVGAVGNVLFRASDPAGSWSDPIPLPGVHGIDPDLAWDEDGTCWCTYAGVEQVAIDPATGRTLGVPNRVWSGSPGAQAPEAPHLYQIDGQWYLLLAEGGTERGHSVTVARGPAPTGPFEPCPRNPVLTHRGLSSPIQNTGHADLVQAPDGSWWTVLLAVRPGGGTPGWHVLGRETFLAPVTWEDGWPVVAPLTEQVELPWPLARTPARAACHAAHDDFDAVTLDPSWVTPRRFPAQVGETASRPGWLSLSVAGASLDDPDVAFVGRRQQLPACTARARLDVGPGVDGSPGKGGLAVRLDEQHHYEIEVEHGASVRVRAIARIGPLRQVLGSRTLPASVPVVVRIVIDPTTGGWEPCQGPDTVILGFEDADDTFVELARLDGRYLSTEVAGGFTGRVIGVYATSGTVSVDWFDLRATA